ncbi:hypothetical protein [Nocardioides luteus]|uniref:hypothetical protein n=1 Tax=Nocardioides luteus TaxID=1844 RepID=UPI000B2B6348|nr:hypothetical protein [Nocardioides luteus]
MTDPFFAALRARRPDVDLVILPPADPPEPSPEATADELSRSAEAVDATVAAIAARLPEPTGDGPRWETYDHDNVRRWAQLEARTTDGGTTLEGLDQAFRDARWRSSLAVKAFHRWTASQPEVQIVGTWSASHHALVVTVTGRVLHPAPGAREVLT